MAKIAYSDSPLDITVEQLEGFFAGWPNRPSPAALLRVLHGSDHVVLALDAGAGPALGRVVGYITAITDGVSAAYIPHLEVLEPLRGQGIGAELVRRMLVQLRSFYMIDLICDPDLQPFYARLGFRPSAGMVIRNYDRQALEQTVRTL